MSRLAQWLVALLGFAVVGQQSRAAEIVIDTPMSPPACALLERELLKANKIACQEFFQRYFDDRGYLECVERWGGDAGRFYPLHTPP